MNKIIKYIVPAIIIVVILSTLVYRVFFVRKVGLEIEACFIIDGKKIKSKQEFIILKYEGKKLRTIGLSINARWHIKDPLGNPTRTQIRYIFIVFPIYEGELYVDGDVVNRLDLVLSIYDYWRYTQNPFNKIAEELYTDMYNYLASVLGVETIPKLSEVYEWLFCNCYVTSSYWKSFVEAITYLDFERTKWLYHYIELAYQKPNTLLVERNPQNLNLLNRLWQGLWEKLTATKPVPIDVSDGDSILSFNKEIEGYKYYLALKYAPFIYKVNGEFKKGHLQLDKMIGRRIRVRYAIFVLFQYKDITGEWSNWYFLLMLTKPIELEIAEGTWITVTVESTHRFWAWG